MFCFGAWYCVVGFGSWLWWFFYCGLVACGFDWWRLLDLVLGGLVLVIGGLVGV